jgi:hypothetical protein
MSDQVVATAEEVAEMLLSLRAEYNSKKCVWTRERIKRRWRFGTLATLLKKVVVEDTKSH